MLPNASGEWAEWLRTKKWDYWATGTFSHVVVEHTAYQCAEVWVKALQVIRERLYQSDNRVYAAIAIERGDMFGAVHVHMLVGGLGAHPALLGKIERAWEWGHMLVSHYDPTQDPRGRPKAGACAYLTKQVENVHLIGKMKKHRPRVHKPPRDY